MHDGSCKRTVAWGEGMRGMADMNVLMRGRVYVRMLVRAWLLVRESLLSLARPLW